MAQRRPSVTVIDISVHSAGHHPGSPGAGPRNRAERRPQRCVCSTSGGVYSWPPCSWGWCPRSLLIPRADAYIAYLTLLNERDGGIHGVPLVWEECETVFDATRTVECYERLKAKGPAGAAVFHPMGTPPTYALTERATQDQNPPAHGGLWACGTPRMGGCFPMSSPSRSPTGVRTRPSSASSANGPAVWRSSRA